MKTKIIPFNLEIAKKIQAGEIEGKIMYNKAEAEIIDLSVFVKEKTYICARTKGNSGEYGTRLFLKNGNDVNDEGGTIFLNLYLEVPDDEPQFEPFDKVLVRDDDEEYWKCALFSHENEEFGYCASSMWWKQCIPYEGNEHLVGTTR